MSSRRALALIASPLLAVLSFTACADDAADRAALDAATQAWVAAFNARDADAMAALTTEDMILLPPNAEPVRGRDAVREVWKQAVSTAKATASISTEETVIAGDIAYKLGSFTYTLPTGTVVGRGKFLEIWKRVDGKWKIHRDMFSGNAPAPKPEITPMPPVQEPRLDAPTIH